MLTGMVTCAGWRVRESRVRVRGHGNFPMAFPYPLARVAGSEPADHAEILVLYSLSLIIIYVLGRNFPKHRLHHQSAAKMSDLQPPTERKRTINPKLLDDNNVSTDALKRHKLVASKSVTQPQSSNVASPSARVTPSTSQRASVEVVEDDDDAGGHNAGSPKNADTILESVNDEGDNVINATQRKGKGAERAKRKDIEMEDEPEETDEDELSKLRLIPFRVKKLN